MTVLYILHRPPSGIGGIERHTKALVEALRSRCRVSVCYPNAGRLWLDQYSDTPSEDPRSLAFPLESSAEDARWAVAYEQTLRCLLEVARPSVAHVQHLEGHALSGLEVLVASGIRTFVSLRDYYLLCPSFHLQREGGGYCGVPASDSMCDACLATSLGWRAGALAKRRRCVDQLLRRVDGVIVPHPRVLEVFGRVFDVAAWRTHTHEHGLLSPAASSEMPDRAYFSGRLRVAFVGTAQPVKGYGSFLRLADRLAGDEVDFVHLGNLAEQPAHARIDHLGPYTPGTVVSTLRNQRIHLILMLLRCPETHSHVLSEAMAAGIPVVATDLGAPAERVSRNGVGWTVPVDDVNAVARLVRQLASDRDSLYERSRAAARVPLRTMQMDAAGLMRVYGVVKHRKGRKPPPEAPVDRRRLAHTVEAFAADNALLARQLLESREECERLRRRLGQAPHVSLGVDDVEATRAYQLAREIRRAWLRLPYRTRRVVERLSRGWFGHAHS